MEPETDLITSTPWIERWTDITQVMPTKPIVVPERKPEPMVTQRGVVMVIITIALTLSIVEILFGGTRSAGQTHRFRLGAKP